MSKASRSYLLTVPADVESDGYSQEEVQERLRIIHISDSLNRVQKSTKLQGSVICIGRYTLRTVILLVLMFFVISSIKKQSI